MPKITAATVAEHVANQEAAVIDAATRLFAARGVSEVTIGDVAAEIGLARSSLYRYFPDKAHLIAAWFRTELAPLQEASEAIATSDAAPLDRLDDWLSLHLDYLTAPEHQAMVGAVGELHGLPDDLRDDLAEGHHALYATLGRIVDEHLAAVDPGRDAATVTMLVVGMLRSAAELVLAGRSRATVADELHRTARAALS